ncbi:MAG TPA: hypothetical protein VK548_26805, partial [Candidatus Acidoferrum sp.]|nr:hypothetical protein [Candidatus Acidoferrum sp.]
MRVISAEILEVDLDLREPTDLPFEAGQWISVPFGPKNVRAYSIASTPLPKIGPGLKATLASYGIETAADVASRTVSAVPGFGATRTKELLLWRQ